MDNIEKALDAGIRLRARQEIAKEAIIAIKEGKDFQTHYEKFSNQLWNIKDLMEKYPDKEAPKIIYNHLVDLIEIYKLQDSPYFNHIKKIE